MILYFSGTGNSEHAAKRIGQETADEVLNLFERLKNKDYSRIASSRPWVVVTPTYAWRIPRILEEWLKRTELAGSRDIYFVMTCGENIGNAGKYLRALCTQKGMCYRGCLAVVMPENYIALFSAPDEETAEKIIRIAGRELEGTIRKIQRNESLERNRITLAGRLESGPVHKIFCRFIISDRKFRVKDSCTSCGKCVSLCPLNNIQLDDNGRPVWNGNCTHCMACICGCPSESIEYGKRTEGKRRYFLK